MTTPVHIIGIAGSLRKASYNAALLRGAGELLPEGMTMEIFDLLPIPLYNGDVEQEGMPEPVQQLRDKIAAADGLLISTPEYNHSIPGVLKNTIDWLSRPPSPPLGGKPVALMGGGGGFGSVRAQVHLRYILVNLNMLQLNKPEVLLQKIWEHFDDTLYLSDEKTREKVQTMLSEFYTWILQTRAMRDG
jgi:chromate reductase